MPSLGRSDSARLRDRRRQPWEEHVLAHSGPHWGRPRWANLWMPVILSFLFQVPAVFFRLRFGGGVVHSELWGQPGQLLLAFILAVIGPLALIGARRFPGPVVAIAAAAGVADFLLFRESSHPPYIALAFAIISAIVRGARIWAWISVAGAWAIGLTVALVMGLDLPPQRIAAVTFGILLLMGIGEGIRTRRDRFSEISRRVAERKQSELAAERVRIARELHDVLAHSLSQINVQAGVGLHLMDRQPDKAKEALARCVLCSASFARRAVQTPLPRSSLSPTCRAWPG
jgi:signal transduction histidine kinase